VTTPFSPLVIKSGKIVTGAFDGRFDPLCLQLMFQQQLLFQVAPTCGLCLSLEST
jgi:hypothetical protein